MNFSNHFGNEQGSFNKIYLQTNWFTDEKSCASIFFRTNFKMSYGCRCGRSFCLPGNAFTREYDYSEDVKWELDTLLDIQSKIPARLANLRAQLQVLLKREMEDDEADEKERSIDDETCGPTLSPTLSTFTLINTSKGIITIDPPSPL